VGRSCAAKRRGQHRFGWSWQKSKTAANGGYVEARRRACFGGKAEKDESCKSTQSFRAVESRFMRLCYAKTSSASRCDPLKSIFVVQSAEDGFLCDYKTPWNPMDS
jgi:hypothetical protein